MRLKKIILLAANFLLFYIIFQMFNIPIGFTESNIIVLDTYAARERVDLSEVTYVGYLISNASNEEPLAYAEVTFKDRIGLYYTNAQGWCILPVYSNEIGKKSWSIQSITYWGTQLDFQQNISDPEIIFDKVTISIPSISRIGVGINSSLSYSASYIYDGRNFTGKVVFNENYIYSDNVGKKEYYVKKIVDEKFGITRFQSNTIEVIFDKVKLYLDVNDNRIDVNDDANIFLLNGTYLYDGSEFRDKFYLNDTIIKNKVGKYTFTVKSIEDNKYNITVFESNSIDVIFDKVILNISVIDDRVNVGDKIQIYKSGYYAYDDSSFEGIVYLNNDDLELNNVGSIESSVIHIDDILYQLNAFSSNNITVIWDRVIIELFSKFSRINVGDEVVIEWNGVYEFDGSPFSHENEVVLNLDDFIKKYVGYYVYDVTKIVDKIHGISVFTSKPYTVIWDIVDVEIIFPYDRIEVGTKAEPIIIAEYRYDGSSFQGKINLNGSLVQNDLRSCCFIVSTIEDVKYNLIDFKSNTESITYDRIVLDKKVMTDKLGIIDVAINIYYESDKSFVQDFNLICNGKSIQNINQEEVLIHLSNWSPIYRLNVELQKEVFPTIYDDAFYYCIGNMAMCFVIIFPLIIYGIISYYRNRI